MGRNFTWPEYGADGREAISLIWETPSVIDVDNAGDNGWVAISLGRKTDPMAGNRNRWPKNDFPYLANAADDRCR